MYCLLKLVLGTSPTYVYPTNFGSTVPLYTYVNVRYGGGFLDSEGKSPVLPYIPFCQKMVICVFVSSYVYPSYVCVCVYVYVCSFSSSSFHFIRK